MDKDKQQAIALMRYSAIAPMISGVPEEYPSMSTYFRDLSEKGILHPSGQMRKYAPSTMKSWLLDYRKGGFDALIPKSRSDHGTSRKIDRELDEQIRYLRHTYPRLSAAAIYRQLQDNGSIRSGQVSESTVLRFIKEMNLREQFTNNQDLRRYERPHINEVWCGDSSVGPYLTTDDGRLIIFVLLSLRIMQRRCRHERHGSFRGGSAHALPLYLSGYLPPGNGSSNP